MTARIKLQLGPTGLGTVELDGVDISTAVDGINLRSRVDEPTEVLLNLPVVEIEADADVRLHLHEDTRALLLRCGWTPPAEEAS